MNILHIALGRHNTDMNAAFDAMGDCRRITWTDSKHTLDRDVLNLLKTFTPDLTFMQIQRGSIISPKTVEQIPGIVFNWTGDVRDPIPYWMEQMPCITLFSNQTDVDTFRAKGKEAEFWNCGFENTRITCEGDKIDGGKIVFMGANYGNFPLSHLRLSMVMRLKEQYGDDFQVYGNNWGFPTNNTGNDYNLMCPIYRGCDIGINLSHFNYKRYSSDRIFRIMGSGAFCLSHHYHELEKDFEVGVHLDTWHDLNELTEKIDYYLTHPAERQKIAKAGCELVHNKHTWQERTKELHSIYEAYTSTERRSIHNKRKTV